MNHKRIVKPENESTNVFSSWKNVFKFCFFFGIFPIKMNKWESKISKISVFFWLVVYLFVISTWNIRDVFKPEKTEGKFGNNSDLRLRASPENRNNFIFNFFDRTYFIFDFFYYISGFLFVSQLAPELAAISRISKDVDNYPGNVIHISTKPNWKPFLIGALFFCSYTLDKCIRA